MAAKEHISLKVWLRVIGGIAGILVGLGIALAAPPEGLTDKAMIGMGVFIWAIIWMLADVLPDYAMGLLLCTGWVVSGSVPFNVAFSAYGGGTFWLVIGGLGIGFAATHSGLMKRLALFLMTKFPLTFKGQTLALICTGTAITPLVPSNLSKVALMAPLSQSISENMGYKGKSEEAGGIFAAMFVGTSIIYPLFLSSGFMCYVLKGLLPEPYKSDMNWATWFINALPWGLTVLVLSYIAIQLMYRSSGQKVTASAELVHNQLRDMGPMSRKEILAGLLIGIAFILWITEPFHKISAVLVALPTLALLIGCNVIDRASFRSGVPWDAIIFVGATFNIAPVFKTLKIEDWFAKLCGPYIEPIMAQNIFAFLIVLAVFLYVARVILAGQTAVLTIFTVFLTPFALNVGISPWICGFAIFTSMNVFYVMYQSSQYITAYYATRGEMVTYRQVLKLCLAYMVISLIGLLVSVPFWMMTGLIK